MLFEIENRLRYININNDECMFKCNRPSFQKRLKDFIELETWKT